MFSFERVSKPAPRVPVLPGMLRRKWWGHSVGVSVTGGREQWAAVAQHCSLPWSKYLSLMFYSLILWILVPSCHLPGGGADGWSKLRITQAKQLRQALTKIRCFLHSQT